MPVTTRTLRQRWQQQTQSNEQRKQHAHVAVEAARQADLVGLDHLHLGAHRDGAHHCEQRECHAGRARALAEARRLGHALVDVLVQVGLVDAVQHRNHTAVQLGVGFVEVRVHLRQPLVRDDGCLKLRHGDDCGLARVGTAAASAAGAPCERRINVGHWCCPTASLRRFLCSRRHTGVAIGVNFL